MGASDRVFNLEEIMDFPLTDGHYIVYLLLQGTLLGLQYFLEHFCEIDLVVFKDES